jgi:hypothetical protein
VRARFVARVRAEVRAGCKTVVVLCEYRASIRDLGSLRRGQRAWEWAARNLPPDLRCLG